MPEGEVRYKIRGDKSELPNDLKKAEQIIGNSSQAVEKAAGAAIKAIGAAAAAAGTVATAIGTAIVKSADDLERAAKRITAATGDSAKSVESYEKIISEVYGDNFGESFDDIAVSISKVTQNLGEMDDNTPKNVTERAYTLQDVFDMAVDESSRAAKALAENFGVSAEEAYDYIAKGAQDGLDYSEELLDSISEYSVQFKKLGFSADDMFNIFAQGAENGAWNLDKVGDAIKEFSIRAIDGSDTTKKALDAEKESTAISMDSMLFNTESTEANTYFKAIAEQAGASGYLTATGGNLYFSGSYEDRIAALNDLYSKMVNRYVETNIDDYGIIEDRLNEQITNLKVVSMTFKIGDIDVSKLIIPPEMTDTFRSQSVNYTLNGSAVVDRISEITKKRITVQIPLIPSDKWEEIKAVIKPISFSVSVDSTSYTVHLDGDIPTPVLYADGDNIMCSDISLTFEEM